MNSNYFGTRVDSKFFKHWVCLCLFTFLVVLPTLCFHLRFSVYSKMFKDNRTEGQMLLNRENDKRIKFTNRFLKNRSYQMSQVGETIDVGISIISVSRNRHGIDNYEPKYLSQVIAHFMYYLEKSSSLKLNYQIFVCNVDDEPSTFEEALNISHIVPTFNRFPNYSFSHRRTISSRLEKEKEDYIFCGEQTLLQNVSYVFLVEDDALPHKDLFTVLDYLLTVHKDKLNVTYVKFYHPDRLLGFISFELERIPELIGLSITMAALLVSVYQKFLPTHKINYLVLWIASITYFLLVFTAIGRQHINEIRRISKYFYQITPAPSCCTPANLYTRHGMKQTINYLKGVRCYSKFGKDTAIDQFIKKSKLGAVMIQPNLFQHIGMYSSLRDNLVNPFIV